MQDEFHFMQNHRKNARNIPNSSAVYEYFVTIQKGSPIFLERFSGIGMKSHRKTIVRTCITLQDFLRVLQGNLSKITG